MDAAYVCEEVLMHCVDDLIGLRILEKEIRIGKEVAFHRQCAFEKMFLVELGQRYGKQIAHLTNCRTLGYANADWLEPEGTCRYDTCDLVDILR